MTIRAANAADAAELARLIILAMDDIAAKFVGGSAPQEAIPLFEKFAALPANQYSYENILVCENEEGVCGMISAYDGARLDVLRRPFLDHLEKTYALKYRPEDETQPGEYYLDCISVAPSQQGKGVGKALITAMVKFVADQGHETFGLLVNKENPQAQRLYGKLGFTVVEEIDFMGGKYFHMQYKIR